MGLLDKAGDTPAPAKKPVAKKAAPKPAPKAVEKQKRAAKQKKAKTARSRAAGLPSEYEIAPLMSRTISWWTNFAINFGVFLAAIGMTIFVDTSVTTTILFGVALTLMVFNIILIPLRTGRTIGHFVSRTKYITSDGNKANVVHSFFANTTGLFALMGLFAVGINWAGLQEKDNTAAILWFVAGIIAIIVFFVNRNFKKNSEFDQGLYDTLFRAYLVKHVPSEDDASTGIWARLENMGNWGDKMSSNIENREKKAAAKAAAKAAKEEAKKAETEAAEEESGE